uniref:Uncharacterized protein n=1 Tax=Curvibacter symbiont subsp. Hydra magnipapillata TaxID=667019 RepID=C9Y8Y6_CURXX|nr:hypothetical protein Csp_A05870 [Curvibacter putative symbiont of Hydra magnipapillata]
MTPSETLENPALSVIRKVKLEDLDLNPKLDVHTMTCKLDRLDLPGFFGPIST